MADELIDVRETAAALRISIKTLYNWKQRGAGPPWVKVGSRTLYRRSDLEAWLGGHLAPTERDAPVAGPTIDWHAIDAQLAVVVAALIAIRELLSPTRAARPRPGSAP
jgi:predicted DNA-binding transcriptional regulator AlpA